MRFSFKFTACAFALTLGITLFTPEAFAADLLKVGSRGAEVSNIQHTLKDKGYFSYHTATGYYGYITKDAVIRFQADHGLAADGIVGPQTINTLYDNKNNNSNNSETLKFRSRGNEVSKLQQALQDKGYFNHSVTGYYGHITENAVIEFQKDYGLRIDGIAGSETLNALYNSNTIKTQTVAHNQNLSEDIYWLSRIIEAEAQGESYAGKVAVGNVVINRVKSADFPNAVKGVIFEYYQGIPMFSPVANGTIYNTPSQESIDAAYQSYKGDQIVGNATYFFNPQTAQSSWISKNKVYVGVIGNHVFYA